MLKVDGKDIAAPEVKAADVNAASDAKKENSEPRESNKKSGGKSGPEKESQASQLITMGKQAELFHTPSGELYATVRVEKHLENWKLESAGFRSWLTQQYYRACKAGPSAYAIDEALDTLKAVAQFDGKEHEVFIRVAQLNGSLYLDLANKAWQAVRVSEDGWKLVDKSPVKFIREKGMESIPIPTKGGCVDELKQFVNFSTDDDFKLIVAWTLGAFTYGKPYPILILGGEQGCAKSTTSKMLRKLVDPNTAALRTVPKDEQNLAIMSNNSHIIALDNLSGIRPWASDALCRISTGGATSTRKLYTDSEEILFEAKRPIILNGIGDVGTAGDLLDRSILLTLPRITTYKTERQIEQEFEEARPRILGALLSVVADGLKNLPDAPEYGDVRMADFASWIGACEPALGWKPDSFITAYANNRSEARQVTIEASPIAEPVRNLVMEKMRWVGSAGELLELLNSRANETVTRRLDWPRSPERLAGLLNRVAPDLRKNGVEVRKLDTRASGTGKRQWLLEKVEDDSQLVSKNDVADIEQDDLWDF